ncbi:DnaB-like helicase C-terminal domain-containing protein [Cyanobacterium sp. DS4]|uniref:DnaB-like helicase C-terminal domain-containing protein n=1 Tax=Cyanobacterium sp. DS4 TaxID=2878255 RepID=UPI002E80480D|nr:DnaB-like helicase C-terminal domain-containing protein [Cyanobacterium sp. Dongsha4]WVL02500.1 hypothetical protein Dongsha4_18700 [Cyanobacterium sp. Dongsha4]
MNDLIKEYYRLILHSEPQRFAIAVKEGNEVKYPHQSKHLTEADIIKSIEGKLSLGVMLLTDNSPYLTKSGVIDIDTPRDAKDLSEGLALAKKLKDIALESNLRAYIEFSGNRGYHLWIFVNKPITGELMQKCLRAIALKAKFEAKEIFPNHEVKETKCIKLPFTTHLKSNNRSGFIGEDFNPNNPLVTLESQSELMRGFIQNDPSDIISLVNEVGSEHKPVKEARSKKDIEGKLKDFGSDHPSCIKHLLTNGAPLEVDYNQANLTLIRYCLTKKLSLEESLPLAEDMAKNTSEAHSTSKDYEGKLKNFRSAFNSCDRNRDNYLFGCSYILSGVKENEAHTRGCIGTKCSIHKNHNPNYQKQSSENNLGADTPNNQNISDSLDFVRVNALIFDAMINLSSEGKECVKSQILRESDKIVQNYLVNKDNQNISDSIRLIESEVIGYFLQNPESIIDYSDIFSEGFKHTISKNQSISDYLDNLYSLKIPSPETIEEYIEEIRVNGLKVIATEKISTFNNQIRESDNISDTLNEINESVEEITRLSISDSKLLPVSEKSVEWVTELFSEDVVNIPTFSQDLNYLLNGGLCKGKLYVLGAPPANGKSTVSAQISDIASSKGFRVGYASYEMSADQLFLSAIARYGKINSSLIESKKHFLDKQLAKRILEVCEDYDQKIGENLYLIECDDYHTPSKLLTIIKKLKLDLLIVDYLQLLNTGDNYLDNGNNETLKISKIATELKRVARKTQIPIIAISDINKNAYSMAMKGGDLDLSALRDSFKIAHSADTVMFLTSQNITMSVKDDGNNKSEKSVTQLYLLSEKLRDTSLELSQKIIDLAHQFKLDKNNSDTYSRLVIAKNRGGKCGEVLFRYSKALHYFEPLNYLTANINVNEEF